MNHAPSTAQAAWRCKLQGQVTWKMLKSDPTGTFTWKTANNGYWRRRDLCSFDVSLKPDMHAIKLEIIRTSAVSSAERSSSCVARFSSISIRLELHSTAGCRSISRKNPKPTWMRGRASEANSALAKNSHPRLIMVVAGPSSATNASNRWSRFNSVMSLCHRLLWNAPHPMRRFVI